MRTHVYTRLYGYPVLILIPCPPEKAVHAQGCDVAVTDDDYDLMPLPAMATEHPHAHAPGNAPYGADAGVADTSAVHVGRLEGVSVQPLEAPPPQPELYQPAVDVAEATAAATEAAYEVRWFPAAATGAVYTPIRQMLIYTIVNCSCAWKEHLTRASKPIACAGSATGVGSSHERRGHAGRLPGGR